MCQASGPPWRQRARAVAHDIRTHGLTCWVRWSRVVAFRAGLLQRSAEAHQLAIRGNVNTRRSTSSQPARSMLLRTAVETGSHLHMPAGRSTLTTTDAGSVTFECKPQVPGHRANVLAGVVQSCGNPSNDELVCLQSTPARHSREYQHETVS